MESSTVHRAILFVEATRATLEGKRSDFVREKKIFTAAKVAIHVRISEF